MPPRRRIVWKETIMFFSLGLLLVAGIVGLLINRLR
jgi:hypothetical protein